MTVDALAEHADHRDAERALRAAGWMPCGAGDWAIALRSPDGATAARISPFDPTGTYTAALYLVVARIPASERRFMTEIPLSSSGPWDEAEREAMRAGLAAADARAAARP